MTNVYQILQDFDKNINILWMKIWPWLFDKEKKDVHLKDENEW